MAFTYTTRFEFDLIDTGRQISFVEKIGFYLSTIEEISMTYTFEIGRDAKNGRFLPVAVAKRRKNTAVVEPIKVKKPRK